MNGKNKSTWCATWHEVDNVLWSMGCCDVVLGPSKRSEFQTNLGVVPIN